MKFLTDEAIDGSKLMQHWFPFIKADVFISHSHTDNDNAIRCSSWLQDTFGLTAFVDSCVWGFADELLKEIDNKFCWNKETNTYDYNVRNRTTSHVHMMLANALREMIDSCDCIFFLNTPSSITAKDSVEKTKSPWIFYELGVISTLRQKKMRSTVRMESFAKTAEFNINYNVSLDTLTTLSADDLHSWHQQYNRCKEDPLEALYSLKK